MKLINWERKGNFNTVIARYAHVNIAAE